jgi:hypothetical protein
VLFAIYLRPYGHKMIPLAPSAYCVHGTRNGTACVCDAGWTFENTFFRQDHCNTPVQFAFIVDVLVITVALGCNLAATVWMTYKFKTRPPKAKFTIFSVWITSASMLAAGIAHIVLNAPSFVFWLFAGIGIASIFVTTTLITDMFIDITSAQIMGMSAAELRTTKVRQFLMLFSGVVSSILWVIVIPVVGMIYFWEDPYTSNRVIAGVFLSQIPLHCCLYGSVWAVDELIGHIASSEDFPGKQDVHTRLVAYRKSQLGAILGGM